MSENLVAKIKELEERILQYEQNGAAKLYYALNRKMNEMADILNRQSLIMLDLADAKDKSFERIKVIWDSAEKVALAVKSIGDAAGVTGIEEKDIKPKNKPLTPESMSDSVGQLAGQNLNENV